jgi:salicylate hydroxylase
VHPIYISMQVLVSKCTSDANGFVFQRADFHEMLFGIAEPFMTLRLNCRVVSLDPSVPNLALESGEVVKADVIIGADGVNSTVREFVVGGPDKPIPTGDAAYRAIIPSAELLKDPDLKELIEYPEMTGWMGPNKHIMGYGIVCILSIFCSFRG